MAPSAFSRFPVRLQEAIVSRLGWSSLRPVQEMAARAILDGENAVVLAPTAGGKTEASIFPVVARLMEQPPRAVGALYVAPIKALLNNQEERLGTYTEMVGMRRFVWHGDARNSAKAAFLKEPAELLMTTPESLEVMLLSQRIAAEELFADLRAVIIDEVHAFAGTDRGAHLMSVLERISAMAGGDMQRIGLSATVGNPEEILAWLAGASHRPGRVVDPPRQPRRREILVSLKPTVHELARAAAARAAGRKSLFFCQSRALSETVAERLRGQGTEVFVHHSSVAFAERQAAEERFHHGSNACIVCTSTLELGIDVGDLDLVFQANAPSTVSSFLQRMGRTGRRDGQAANTTFLCETPEAVLQAAAIVELAREGWVEPVERQDRCWPVLVHQLFALTLQFGAISAERCWRLLSRIPDFTGIAREEFDALIGSMVADGHLFQAGGLLSFGQRAEREFGRRNFFELYAVFSSPVLYRVRTGSGRDLGSLEQGFVDRLAEGMTSFLLAGRAWVVEAIRHADKTIIVREAPKGRKPTWGGFVPQYLGYALCRRMRMIVTNEEVPPYADAAALAAIEGYRTELGDSLRRVEIPTIGDEAGNTLWTFAGGRVNSTLRLALQTCWGLRVSADNLAIRIAHSEAGAEPVLSAFKAMANDEWWRRSDNLERMLVGLPNYRLSKFQDILPPRYAAEIVKRYVLDIDTAVAVLRAGNQGQ